MCLFYGIGVAGQTCELVLGLLPLAIHHSRQIKVHTRTMLGLFRQDSEHSEEMYAKSEGLA